MSKCGLFALLFALSLTVLYGSSSVSAASVYDTAYQTTNNLYLHPGSSNSSNWQGQEPVDVTLGYQSLIDGVIPSALADRGVTEIRYGWDSRTNNASESEIETIRQHWNSEKVNWTITSRENVSTTGDNLFFIRLAYTLTDTMQVNFVHNAYYCGGNPGLYINNVSSYISIAVRGGNDSHIVDVWRHTNNTNSNATISCLNDGTGTIIKNYLANVSQVNYPPEYEGELIRDSVTPPNNVSFAPDWYVSEAIDWTVQIHDKNFNTFDDNPFLCADELAPVLHWSILDVTDPNDPQPMKAGIQSATAQITWQAPKVDEQKHYEITGHYECGDDNPSFDQYGNWPFAISEYGLLTFEHYYECLIDEPPYVNVDGCTAAFERFINLLAFGEISFGLANDWSHNPECHTLSTLGDWINIDNNNRVVCPQFSPSVRSIITPFITFLLGIMTITFIASRGEHGTRKDDI